MARISRDQAASRLAAAEVAMLAPGDRLLVIGDPLPDVAEAAVAAGASAVSWSRRTSGSPLWPDAAPDGAEGFDVVAVRLPRARDELDMLLHIAADRLRVGGRLLVHGANDEGIRSAPPRISALFRDCITRAVGGHARLLAAIRPEQVDGLRAGIDAWRTVHDVRLPGSGGGGQTVRWVSYPGVFAHGRVDPATHLLAEHLPEPPRVRGRPLRVLDWGTGSGYLAAAVLAAIPDAEVHAVDEDACACAAARENVPGVQVHHADAATIAHTHGPFDMIVANPSYHDGKTESMQQIESLLTAAATSLAPDGVLRMVVQRRLQIEAAAHVAGLACKAVADHDAFRVWELRR